MPKFDFTNNIDAPSNYFRAYSDFEINLRLRKKAMQRKKFKQQQNLDQPKIEQPKIDQPKIKITKNLSFVGKDLDNELDEITKNWEV